METPLLRVSRPVSACARCRNAKIKCDGRLPACSACEKAGKGAECSSANDLFAKGKERSYVASLELRIERLEKQVAQAKAEKDGLLQGPYMRNFTVARPIGQTAEASDVDELVSDFGYLVLNATSTGYNGFDKEMSFARLAIATATVEALPPHGGIGLPPRDVTLSLVRECSQAIFSFYPVLTESSIYGSIESVYQHQGIYSSPVEIWNVRLILALGLLCRSTAKGDHNYQEAARHVAVAMDQAEAVLQPGITVTTQAILLLSLYSILDPYHFSPWYLLSIAVRVWLDIGLHQEPAHLRRAAIVAQNHRRLFYCMYSLDRAVAFSFVRLLSFTDDSVDVDLPSNLTSPRFQNPSLAFDTESDIGGYFILLTKFRQAESRYYQKLFGSKREMLNEPWYNRPHDLVSIKTTYHELVSNGPDGQRNVLGLDLHYLIILLLRPSEKAVTLDPYGMYLLFDASVAYSQSLTWLTHHNSFTICCTSLELLRATRVASYLLDALRDPSCPILEDSAPREPPSLLGSQLPFITRRTPTEAISTVIDFCSNMHYSLDALGCRFGRLTGQEQLMEELGATLQSFETRHRNYHIQGNHELRTLNQPVATFTQETWQSAPMHQQGH